MAEPGEGAPSKSPDRRNVRAVREARRAETPPWGDDRGRDGDSARKINLEPPMTPYAKERAKIEDAERARKKLADARLGTGQVNTEQPTTGGKVEPDERDGIRH